MFVSFSFTGGLSHTAPVSREKQREVASKIGALVKVAVETNAVGGSGTLTVGEESVTITATATSSL